MLSNGYDTAVLTDINNSTGTLECIKKGMDAGLRILAGMEFRNGDELFYIGIAKNEKGFKELNDFITERNRNKSVLPINAPDFPNAFIVYPYEKKEISNLKENEYIGIRPLQRTKITMEPKSNWENIKNKATFTGNRYNDKQLLLKYAQDGFLRRYSKTDQVAIKRIQRELEIIENLNFSSYFLITDDICRYARSKDYHYVGR
uniref:DNA_pol3_alpha domain-containing protein n=1 Tax=Parastrongyloides trichosuri TaxID=131310 RepID=A0A0N5A7H6_PARTI